MSRYARWVDELKRRETWEETVVRLVDYYKAAAHLDDDIAEEIFQAVYKLEVMPSMRALMAAGPALDRCKVAAFNCAYLPVDHPRAFDEAMYILMCGTGVGYSVEEKYTKQLPTIPAKLNPAGLTITVEDSKEGWASAFKQLVGLLYLGEIPNWDVSLVRPEGARLKTFGGRASGPAPLVDLFKFTVNLFKNAAGRRLTTVECHDLMCKIADIVVVGGVRRSAMISLSDVTDDRMRVAKSGEWWNLNPQRRLANNSAVYDNRKPDMELFFTEWKSLYDSKSGERGFFNRAACDALVARTGRRATGYDWGCNPCSEIILRPYQFCNLTEIIVRSDDTLSSLKRKARVASILGTIQSTFTEFSYLRDIWRKNTEEERLLGVSLSGIYDNRWLVNNVEDVLSEVRQTVIDVNQKLANYLGIPPSAATTAVKPSGTVSQMVNCASGMHARHSKFYIRSIRADIKDPICQFLMDKGVPYEQDLFNTSNKVFYFPVKSPEGAVVREDLTALEHLEMWKSLQMSWCEHKPSATVSVREHEWLEVGAWVYKNFDIMSGVSFLPYDGGSYRQAPYQDCTEEEYLEFKKKMPVNIDWLELQDYETDDNTTGSQELACSASGCEI